MSTVTLQVPESQVVDWVRQLSPAGRHAVLRELILDFDTWELIVDEGERRIRTLGAERGIDWDQMDDADRERFVDGIVHESRP